MSPSVLRRRPASPPRLSPLSPPTPAADDTEDIVKAIEAEQRFQQRGLVDLASELAHLAQAVQAPAPAPVAPAPERRRRPAPAPARPPAAVAAPGDDDDDARSLSSASSFDLGSVSSSRGPIADAAREALVAARASAELAGRARSGATPARRPARGAATPFFSARGASPPPVDPRRTAIAKREAAVAARYREAEDPAIARHLKHELLACRAELRSIDFESSSSAADLFRASARFAASPPFPRLE